MSENLEEYKKEQIKFIGFLARCISVIVDVIENKLLEPVLNDLEKQYLKELIEARNALS